jgi:hypothetical protein
MHALGRLPQFDPRSLDYPIRTLLPTRRPPRSYTWAAGHNLDQANTPHCVGFGCAHELAARPVVVGNVHDGTGHGIYQQCKLIDPFGPTVDGTSVLAGAQVLRHLGHWSEYRWCDGEEDLALTVGYRGPVVIGVSWWTGMFAPDADGFVRIAGRVEGGHCVLVTGISLKRGAYRIRNSWGAGWGIGGDALVRRVDMAVLLADDGEACVPIRAKV